MLAVKCHLYEEEIKKDYPDESASIAQRYTIAKSL